MVEDWVKTKVSNHLFHKQSMCRTLKKFEL